MRLQQGMRPDAIRVVPVPFSIGAADELLKIRAPAGKKALAAAKDAAGSASLETATQPVLFDGRRAVTELELADARTVGLEERLQYEMSMIDTNHERPRTPKPSPAYAKSLAKMLRLRNFGSRHAANSLNVGFESVS